MDFNGASITMTYGDRAENHNGMQIIGEMAEHGFTIEQLKDCKRRFEHMGVKCKMINLNKYVDVETESAKVLVIRKGVDCLLKTIGKTADDMYEELTGLKWDTKAYMYGRVVNKKARYNLCISDKQQKPDYANGKGTIIAFKKLECCNAIREQLPEYLEGSDNLVAEGNYYYDRKCGIGWHGDSERRKVVAVKLGDVPILNYQWYQNGNKIGKLCQIQLSHGDIYIMSEKAVGTDWKKKKVSSDNTLLATLRHSTGFPV
jgi:alkylated DNA repair dioxygenase AlkB